MSNKRILFTVENSIAKVSLNRPDKANSFDGKMWLELDVTADLIRKNPDIKVVILTGEGKSFCGGLDINQASTEGIFLGDRTYRDGNETLQYLSDVFTLYENLPLPVIAAVNGGCIGLGFELALACDLRLASDSAVFSIPEVVFGLVPDCGGTQRLPRLIGPAMAKELIYTGKRIDAAEALRIGLVNHLYPKEKLLEETYKLAHIMAGHPEKALQASKRCINAAMSSTLETGLKYETTSAEAVLGEKLNLMVKTDHS